MPSNSTMLLPELRATVERCLTETDQISAERQALLSILSDFISECTASHQPSRLIFICTHNSRRSHMAQLWAQVAADVFSVAGV